MARFLLACAVAHLAVSAAHGVSHAALGIWPSAAEGVFIAVAVYALPAVAILTRGRVGSWLLAAGLAGSLVFGLHHHFLAVSPDHVAHLPAGPFRLPFQATAAASVPIDAAGLVASLVALWRGDGWRRG